MKRLAILLPLLCGCGGNFQLNAQGFVFQSGNRQLSCYSSNANSNCCFPYKEKLMLCLYPDATNAMVIIKFVPENKGN